MNAKLLLLSVIVAAVFSGCTIEPITACEDMGSVQDLRNYKFSTLGSNCNVKTDMGVFRLVDQDVCKEIFLDEPIFKCVQGISYVWTQGVSNE